ncbi:MAG: glutamate synthase (NADPH/NADH) small chain [Hyphomicrobiaceae bacterium]|jgi:glutamate synthase (NADPH/NADH) small chain
MGKITGFMEVEREVPGRRPIEERLRDYNEFDHRPSEEKIKLQGARCMDCGVPFCHNGCPLGNVIPDWNDLVYRGRWDEAIAVLHSTNNFPEFTGRVCPAPCEEACVLNINDDPVTIKLIERTIIDQAWDRGIVRPLPAQKKTGKKIAVIGSGPAGMACSQQLARAGHDVTLFERADRIGGLLRYGIPDFKMEKHLIDRRVEQMSAEGVTFRTNTAVGTDVSADDIQAEFDAVVLSVGSTTPRDLPVNGRELTGVHYAMDFLPQQNKRNAGDSDDVAGTLKATGKNVVVIGGGDTGSDCIGTSNRQGANNVYQLEIMPEPPKERTVDMPWPYWPMIYRTSSSHEEGVNRDFAVSTRRIVGDDNGKVKGIECVRVEWIKGDDGRMSMKEVADSEFTIDADLVLLAMGFVGPEKNPLLDGFGLETTDRGNIAADENYMSGNEGVFACGDSRRGQSLVVWAIWEGRECARSVDKWLMGETNLPSTPELT